MLLTVDYINAVIKDNFCEGLEDGQLYPDVTDCQAYVYCSSGYPYRAHCERGLFYDGRQQACVYEETSCQLLRKQLSHKNGSLTNLSTTATVTTSAPSTTTTTITTQTLTAQKEIKKSENDIETLREVNVAEKGLQEVKKRRTVRKLPGLDTYCTARADGSYPDPHDCRLYIVCSNGFAYQGTCPKRLVYIAEKRKCYFGTANTCKEQRERSRNNLDLMKATAVAKKAASLADLSEEKAEIYGHQQTMRRRIAQLMPVALRHAMSSLTESLQQESFQTTRLTDSRDISRTKLSLLNPTSPLAKQLSLPAYVINNSSSLVIKQLGLGTFNGMTLLRSMGSPLPGLSRRLASDVPLPRPTPGTCPWPKYSCPPSLYRSHDGSCNNLKQPLWGRAFTPMRRFIAPDYSDGISIFRKAQDGSDLPNPRKVTALIHEDKSIPSDIYTMMTSLWGEFIGHDLQMIAKYTISEDPRGYGRTMEPACGKDGCTRSNDYCHPIPVPVDDQKQKSEKSCIPYVRSQTVNDFTCSIGPAQQLNQVTSYLDGSMLYGSSVKQSHDVRDITDITRGRLSITPSPHGKSYGELLPRASFLKQCLYDIKQENPLCFHSGDNRANIHPGMTSLYTILLRHHNDIEAGLHSLNPSWDGDRLYEETRRIIIAIIQHITYNEYLPVIIGPNQIRNYQLDSTESDYHEDYDTDVDASIDNGFATAASQFIYSTMSNAFNLNTESMNVTEVLFRPSALFDKANTFNDFLKTMTSSKMESIDRFVQKDLHGEGSDVIAESIQQARDHGIAGYTAWRRWCGLQEVSTFGDIEEIPDEVIEKLKQLYKSVDDIDLLVAGLSEKTVDNGLVGPTFSCILGNQFKNLKRGDRFWYENKETNGFTLDQLKEIKKMSLAKLLCEGGDDVKEMQPLALQLPFRQTFNDETIPGGLSELWFYRLWESRYNSPIGCERIPGINLQKWKDAL